LQLISAIDRHRHCTEHPIKFISVRQNVVKFKIKPGTGPLVW
jgi:de-etiolated-1